ncbi:MAG TPA: PEP-CTERM sorting domain-containing protein [Fimbriimonadaceae bacterium]|nr:PEP-CTERM sorting domain-containing protein [Fimbriimonadaceae bacterium]
MKIKKAITIALATAGASSAFAQYSSPELILVADQGGKDSNNNIHVPKIDRYDPTTGNYLGSFGSPYLSDPTAIAIVGQDAYVADTFTFNNASYSRIDKFNFSTGAYDGSIFNAGPDKITGLATYGGNILAVDSGVGPGTGGIYTLAPDGSVLGKTLAAPTMQDNRIAIVGGTAWVTATGSPTGTLWEYGLNPDGTLGLGGGPSGQYHGVAAGTGNLTGNLYDTGIDSNGYEFLQRRDSSGNLISSYSWPYAGYYYNPSLAMGHDGGLYALVDYVGYWYVERFDGGNGMPYGPQGFFEIDAYTSGHTWLPTDMAVYAAPEPVTMVGLGLGVFGLLARRRRRIGGGGGN